MTSQLLKKWSGQRMHINLIQRTVQVYQQLVSIFINLSRSLEERYAEIADFQRKHME